MSAALISCIAVGGQLIVIRKLDEFFGGIWTALKMSIAAPLIRKQTAYNDTLRFIALGTLLGYPFLSTYYSRSLIVIWSSEIPPWKFRLLRERDVTDAVSE